MAAQWPHAIIRSNLVFYLIFNKLRINRTEFESSALLSTDNQL